MKFSEPKVCLRVKNYMALNTFRYLIKGLHTHNQSRSHAKQLREIVQSA